MRASFDTLASSAIHLMYVCVCGGFEPRPYFSSLDPAPFTTHLVPNKFTTCNRHKLTTCTRRFCFFCDGHVSKLSRAAHASKQRRQLRACGVKRRTLFKISTSSTSISYSKISTPGISTTSGSYCYCYCSPPSCARSLTHNTRAHPHHTAASSARRSPNRYHPPWVQAHSKHYPSIPRLLVLQKRVSVKRSYGICDWDRTHIAVEREHIRSGEIIVPISFGVRSRGYRGIHR